MSMSFTSCMLLPETAQLQLRKVFANTQSYNGAEQIGDERRGSLIFDVVLRFNTQVAEDVIISTIQNAITDDGKLGELRVNVSSIIGIPPVPLPATTPPLKTPSKPESDNTWIIVGAVLGAVALVIIVTVIIWFVRKKKFPKKQKEVSDTNVAGQGRGGGAQGKSGGDESAYESAYSNASVLPPSKKPTNTGKEDAGQAVALPVYAQVDKSKKKPRSEREAQRQPGELLYVQADHSNEGSLPTKASGNPSRPPPYQDTVYADLV
ncbi:uncharacterized protein [Montipora capricornis]|uniref:uncharacterized protein n=1 Tax=Montipora capricornis TaxID=246305 RepID=UPI0035F17BAE